MTIKISNTAFVQSSENRVDPVLGFTRLAFPQAFLSFPFALENPTSSSFLAADNLKSVVQDKKLE